MVLKLAAGRMCNWWRQLSLQVAVIGNQEGVIDEAQQLVCHNEVLHGAMTNSRGAVAINAHRVVTAMGSGLEQIMCCRAVSGISVLSCAKCCILMCSSVKLSVPLHVVAP